MKEARRGNLAGLFALKTAMSPMPKGASQGGIMERIIKTMETTS